MALASADPLATRLPGASASTEWIVTRAPLTAAGVASVRRPKADGSAFGLAGTAKAGFASGVAAATIVPAAGAATETATDFDTVSSPLPEFAAKERLVIAWRERRGRHDDELA